MSTNELEEKIESLSISENTSKQESVPTKPNISKISVGSASNKGRRDKNEDAHVTFVSLEQDPTTSFFAVYDGHGGKGASTYCKEKLHKNVLERKCYATDKKKALTKGFIKTDEKYLAKVKDDGSCAVVALLTKSDYHLYVANVGDSRCILYSNGAAKALSRDHKPFLEDEKKRIEEAGHEVKKDTELVSGKRVITYRVDGTTAVSRSIGDYDFKDNFQSGPEQQAITCVPEIMESDVVAGNFLVLACDGVWDVMSNEDVGQYIIQQGQTEKDLNKLASNLATEAINRGSDDNITIVIVMLE